MALIIGSGGGVHGSVVSELRDALGPTVSATPTAVTYSGGIVTASGHPVNVVVITFSTSYSGTDLELDTSQRFTSGTVTSCVSTYNLDFYGLNVAAAAIGAAQAAPQPSIAIWDLLTSGSDQFYVTSTSALSGYAIRAGGGDDLIYSIGEGDDNFTGGVGANIIVAAGGNDLVVAGSLDSATPVGVGFWSYVDGGTGADTIYAGYGANTNLLEELARTSSLTGPGSIF